LLYALAITLHAEHRHGGSDTWIGSRRQINSPPIE
jgi:hypothetical protein